MIMSYQVKAEDLQKVISLTLTVEQLDVIAGALEMYCIGLAEHNDPHLKYAANAQEAIINVLEDKFGVDGDINPDFDEDDANQKLSGKTHKLRVYLHGKNSHPTSVHYFYSKLEAYRYCDTSGIERDGVPVCTMEL